MEKLIQSLKCFLGYHMWKEEPCSYDPDYYTKECIHCKKIQIMYKGDWHNVN